jgi:hypothetical protein
MNRITSEQVLEAYKATGMQPKRNMWLSDTSCCGLTACVLARHPERASDVHSLVLSDGFSLLKYMQEQLNLTYEYTRGFVVGFDNGPFDYHHSEYTAGYIDGIKAGNDAMNPPGGRPE